MVIKGEANVQDIHRDSRARYLRDMLKWHKLGHANGRTLIITHKERPAMSEAFEDAKLKWEAELLQASDVDVKDLLQLGRIMIEEQALSRILSTHQADLASAQKFGNLLAALKPKQESQKLTVTAA